MATTGKVPMLGFKALAIKFATLFGFSTAAPTPATVYTELPASWIPTLSLNASWLPAHDLPATWIATYGLAASWIPTHETAASWIPTHSLDASY